MNALIEQEQKAKKRVCSKARRAGRFIYLTGKSLTLDVLQISEFMFDEDPWFLRFVQEAETGGV